MNTNRLPPLASWQQDFVDQFLSQENTKSLLVAAPGTGKTMTALFAANKMLERKAVDALMVISDRLALRNQWRYAASDYGIALEESLESNPGGNGVSTTLQSLQTKGAEARIEAAARSRRWLIIADDTAYEIGPLASIVDRILSLNEGSKALFISRHVPQALSYEAEFRFRTEIILDRSILEANTTALHVARFSPSFSLLRQLQNGASALDGMSWRAFEKLIATLLEKDGYIVELMKGSKDGGVDVVAVKDLGPNGYFKALWQAKKLAVTNKVGISVVRELADTREEFGASKGIIVTSSYLTRGALQRINRDKYILGKVDREDLDVWIRQTLFRTRDR